MICPLQLEIKGVKHCGIQCARPLYAGCKGIKDIFFTHTAYVKLPFTVFTAVFTIFLSKMLAITATVSFLETFF